MVAAAAHLLALMICAKEIAIQMHVGAAKYKQVEDVVTNLCLNACAVLISIVVIHNGMLSAQKRPRDVACSVNSFEFYLTIFSACKTRDPARAAEKNVFLYRLLCKTLYKEWAHR